MSALFSSPKSPAPVTPPIIPAPAPMKSDAEVMSDANATRERLALAGGRASTILTGPDAVAQPSGQKILLGTN